MTRKYSMTMTSDVSAFGKLLYHKYMAVMCALWNFHKINEIDTIKVEELSRHVG